jgi:choline dehydrogenase-like flavoprotein
MTASEAQYTDFSKDILGRYVCNGFDEAMQSTQGPGARPFDVVIVGGGSFGAALAQHILFQDKFRNHRVLVLEAGPFALPEHVQNLPTLGLVAPGPTTVDTGKPRAEVWGLPWRSSVPGGFPGLAYCVGGRSVFWGGWSPRLLPAETPVDRWPSAVLDDLNAQGGYFDQAARQIGTKATNDFVFGAMHSALRKRLAQGIAGGAVADAVPFAELPLLVNMSGVSANQAKLEAPLAVQGRPPRSGFFPFNKYSGTQLLIRAVRQDWLDSGGDDRNRRLMIVPNCHVTRLETAVDAGVAVVRTVHTGRGSIDLPDRGVVVLALGTIENARLALRSFEGIDGYGLIGSNLISHMRSNHTFRIKRSDLNFFPTGDLEASALFVKGRKAHADGTTSHFHLQITAAGAHALDTNSEAELFQKIPDIDTVDVFRAADEDHVVMTIRGVGEMQPGNPDSNVVLGSELDEFGERRAFVSIGTPSAAAASPQSRNDAELWDAMDAAAQQVLAVFVDPTKVERLSPSPRDGLGTTHHESGTLRMGDDPTSSVTTPNGRFHHVTNAYAIGPSLLPTMGSPNPMLSGVALARRMADHLVAPLPLPAPDGPGFTSLFDGTLASFQLWQQEGPGSFQFVPGENVMISVPDGDIGLLFYPDQAFDDFVLRLQFRLETRDANSGTFVRFHDPRQAPPGLNDPRIANPAWIAVLTGFEAQIDELAATDGADKHRTGAIYDIDIGAGPGQQSYNRGSALEPGEWNDYEIAVSGDAYTVKLNGYETASFTNTDAARGLPASSDPLSGFVGLQAHPGGRVSFRAVRIKKL